MNIFADIHDIKTGQQSIIKKLNEITDSLSVLNVTNTEIAKGIKKLTDLLDPDAIVGVAVETGTPTTH